MASPIVTPQIRQTIAANNQAALAAMPVPRFGPLDMGSSLPALPVPQINARPLSQLERDQDKRDTLVNSTPGVAQIHNPFLRGLAETGDVIGSRFLPGLAAAIPGTTARHNFLVNQAQQNLANDQANQKAADASAFEEANTAHINAETPEVAPNAASTRNMQAATARHLNDEADSLEHPASITLAQAHANAVQKAIKEGRDPSQDPTVNHLANAIIGLQPGQNKPAALKESQPILGPDGKPHVYELDEQGNKVKDLGVHYERPMSVNVTAGLSALDRETKQFGTPYQKSLESSNSQLEKIADARAMINGNAESQGLGIPKVLTALVGGQGTGVRITQAELSSIAHARGLSGDIEGTLNKWAGKGALSRAQQQQLTQIMDDVKARLLQKQAIASATLDAINGASTREQIVEADKAARKQLSDLETGGTQPQHKVGDKVLLGNRAVTIKKINLDGTFDY